MLVLAGLLALLAGCGPRVDPGEARLCRTILPGLNASDARIEIVATEAADVAALGSRPASSGVALTYAIEPAGGRRTLGRILCRFDPGHSGVVEGGHLRSVETESGPLSAARLYMLKRYWLAQPESAAADPEPIPGASRVRLISRGAAVTLQSVLAALPQIALNVLLAAAYALIYGLVGRVNLALGDLAILGSYGALLGLAAAGGVRSATLAPMLAALGLGIWAAASVAAASARLVFARLSQRQGQAALIASAALAVVVSEGVRLAQGSGSRAVPGVLNQPFAVARAPDFIVTMTPIGLLVAMIALVATVVALDIMRRTRFGRRWRAVADDGEAAALVGVDVRRLQLTTFALAGVLAGLAGALATLSYGTVAHGHGLVAGLKALIAAILGGAGSVPGAILAGLAIGLFEAGWSALVSSEHREAALFTILAIALVLRPGGLLGRPELEARHRPDRSR